VLVKKRSSVTGGGVAVIVAEGIGEAVAVKVAVALGAGVPVAVAAGVPVALGVAVTVGGSPASEKVPVAFHDVPTKIWTSYWPACHSTGSRAQLATPIPGGESSHEVASTFCSSPFWYHRAIHGTRWSAGW